ncbi:MAG: ferritin-like domain-containing protein [Deltaproteobacteria bacterium]
MDLDRMLEMCRRDQWRTEDLDWSRTPRLLPRDAEIDVVQLFTNMSAIERLAGRMFEEQTRRAEDPRLRAIFESFVVDEERHADVAQRLARFYDVHHYQDYGVEPALARFTPAFSDAVQFLSDDVANSYITGGELILDVALLRSLNDYVNDPMSQEAMALINRDESRHIAVDYHMTEYYASDDYAKRLEGSPGQPVSARARAAWSFANVLYYAKPFFQHVFFEPMDRVDPSGRRLREAFKRMQLLSFKPGLQRRPFVMFMQALHYAFNHPIAGPVVGRVAARIAGIEPRFMARLYTDAEANAARTASFDQLAEEALNAKFEN